LLIHPRIGYFTNTPLSLQSEDNSACLFDWKLDKNELQVPNGKATQFRFRTSALDEPLDAIPSRKWKEFIKEYYNRRKFMGLRIRPIILQYTAILGLPLAAVALWFLRVHCKHFLW